MTENEFERRITELERRLNSLERTADGQVARLARIDTAGIGRRSGPARDTPE